MKHAGLTLFLLAASVPSTFSQVRVGTVGGAYAGPLRNQSSPLVHVPGDYASVQQAIDGSPPRSRILVHGGIYPSIVIDKPLTIVGDPAPLFVIDDAAIGVAPAPIRLAGPGAGTVVLCNLVTGGYVGGPYLSATESGVAGGGFSELQIYDCEIVAPDWIPYEGLGIGVPGMDVTVDALLVSGSTVAASNTEDSEYPLFGLPPGAPGLRSTGPITIVLNSKIVGGGSDPIQGLAECPGGGSGGPGIEAKTLYHANSNIQGGTGALYFYPGVTICGQAPDGPALAVSEEIPLPSGLEATGTPRLGKPWPLTWSSATGSAVFVAREQSLPPIDLAYLGWWFLDSDTDVSWLSAPGQQQGLRTLFFPRSEAFVGVTVTAQALDLGTGLLAPVVGCVRP